jgi:hypothetical protein
MNFASVNALKVQEIHLILMSIYQKHEQKRKKRVVDHYYSTTTTLITSFVFLCQDKSGHVYVC